MPFEPGHKHGMGRPPRELSITNAMREIGMCKDQEKIRKLAETIWSMALDDKDRAAITTILDRLEGKPQTITPDGDEVAEKKVHVTISVVGTDRNIDV